MPTSGDGDAFPGQLHRVRPRVLPERDRLGGQMSLVGPEAADIHPLGLIAGPEAGGSGAWGGGGKLGGARARVAVASGGGPAGRNGPAPLFARMEERLQVDEDRVLARRDEVLAVEVGRIERVEQRQVPSLALVEA